MRQQEPYRSPEKRGRSAFFLPGVALFVVAVLAIAGAGLLPGSAAWSAWQDSASPRAGEPSIFDSQPIAPPRLPERATSGWFFRDVAAGGALIALTPGGKVVDGVSLSGVKMDRGGKRVAATLKGDGTRNRAITLYYVERFDAAQPIWWRTIRETEILGGAEGTNTVGSDGDAGATGTQTKYPFGCVTGGGKGRALALPPDLGPRLVRIGYHPGSHLLYIAFDLALTPERREAPVAVARYDVAGEWGMRDAARGYYALFPEYYTKRNKVEGIWLPFTDPSHIEHVEDFGIAWHEGDNSVKSDDQLGILSFRYKEPQSYWMPMDPQIPHNYETALAQLQRLASGEETAQRNPEEQRRQAVATLTSGTRGPDGKFQVKFLNAPWCNGAVWTLNPNPAMPRVPGGWNKARENYDLGDADKRYASDVKNGYKGGLLDGEYLDSMEEHWGKVLDYGSDSLRLSSAPPTFDRKSFLPAIPTWFSVWEYANWLRTDLHQRGKLMMGNSTPWSIYAFASLLDAAGTETGWLGGNGEFQPEDDAFMCWRRTLVGRKTYLLLLNTDFDRFTHDYVEKYFQRCLFYGIFPSFFSVNAADKPYWENPKWYDRDRDLFKKYIPVLKKIAAAGWEPVTYARSNNPAVYVERFGNTYLTLLNSGKTSALTELTVDRAVLFGDHQATLTITDVLTGDDLPVNVARTGKTATLFLWVSPDTSRVLRLTVKK